MKLTIFAAIVLAIAVSAAQAQSTTAATPTIAGLSTTFDSLATELPRLNDTMARMTVENEKLMKEYKVYKDDQTQKLAWIAAQVAEQERTVKKPMEDAFNKKNDEIKARCEGKTLDKGPYQRCMDDIAAIEQERAYINKQWPAYAQAWNDKNVAPINAVILKQNARIAQIDAEIKANFEVFTIAQDRSILVRNRIKGILNEIQMYCANKPAPGTGFTYNEWVKYCTNVDWDGASKKLPPLWKP